MSGYDDIDDNSTGPIVYANKSERDQMTLPIGIEQLAALKELEAKATNAPWVCGKADEDGGAAVYATHQGPLRCCVSVAATSKVDGDFIASARNHLPSLLAIAEAARRQAMSKAMYEKRISFYFLDGEYSTSGVGSDGTISIEETRKNGQEDCHQSGTAFKDESGKWVWDYENFSDYDGHHDEILAHLNANPPPVAEDGGNP